MKILAFGDTHGNISYINRIIKLINDKKPDLLICSGDLTNFGGDIKKYVNMFPEDILMLMVPGNHESSELLDSLNNKNLINLHKKSFETDDYIFFGYGEGGFSYVDKEFEDTYNKFKKNVNGKKIILITHAPPFDTAIDYLPRLGNRGNKSFRNFIDELNPLLCVSGHFHENSGKSFKLKETILVNPGPLGKLIEI
ncbi:MAG: metallophosphoesterase [archaeon]